MKIILTQKEMLEIINQYFNFKFDGFTISDNVNRPEDIKNDNLAKRCQNAVSNLNYNNGKDKIAAIKKLRDDIPMPLVTAKWAIEHWDSFIQFVELHNRLPVI